ncbi:MAG: restriction endonuclease subunit S [Thiobacillus sp.]
MKSVGEELPETLPRWGIPSDWKWVSIADVGKVITGNTPPTKDESNYGNFIPFVKPPALTDKGIRSTPEGLSETGVRSSRTLPAGAVLVSCIGGLGKTGIAKVPVAFNQQINAIVFDQRVIPEFGFYYAQTLKPWLHGVSSATTLPIVNKGKFQRAPFPLAPLDQQKCIVEEIEKQFSRLDEAVANLKRVKANLKRYKAAVLKAAVEGRLVETEAERARREGRSFETGAQLLQRILEIRRSQWKGKGKYKEPAAPDTTDLPELPEGWVWASPDQLAESADNSICAGPFGTIFKAKDFRPSGIPIIFLRHVAPGRYLNHKPGFMDVNKWHELFQPYSVYGGELLITKLGEPPGVCAIYPEGVGPAMVTPDVIKLSVNADVVLPRYLMHYFNSETARRFSTGAAFGTTRLRLTIPIFRGMPVPLPPFKEQQEIVAEIDRSLSLADEAEDQVNTNLKRSEILRRCVLQRSFCPCVLA